MPWYVWMLIAIAALRLVWPVRVETTERSLQAVGSLAGAAFLLALAALLLALSGG